MDARDNADGMKARKYLKMAYELEGVIACKRKLLAGIKSEGTYRTPLMDEAPGAVPYRARSRVEEQAVRERMVAEEIERLEEELLELRAEIRDVISSVGDPELEALLEMRYLCYLSWREISARFGYASNFIFRRHREALRRAAAKIL